MDLEDDFASGRDYTNECAQALYKIARDAIDELRAMETKTG